MRRRTLLPCLSAALAAACAPALPAPAPAPPAAAAVPTASPAPAPVRTVSRDSLRPRLPTGAWLDPAAPVTDIGPLPLAMVPAPEGDRVVMLLCGWRQQGVQVATVDGRVLQTVDQPAAFVGLAFSPGGRTLYASGGNQDVVYRYAWANGAATPRDSLVLAVKAPRKNGTRYPAGIGVSPDGRWLYVAENLADSLAVVDLATGRVAARFPTEPYPYGVAVAPDGTVYVSAWGGGTVSVFARRAGRLVPSGRIAVGRHPSALVLNRAGTRLFAASASTDRIAVVDTRARRVVAQLDDAPPAGPHEGSTPGALALSADGTRLFAAEGDANAVGVFDLSAATSGTAAARGNDRLAGRIPAGWYPSALAAVGETLLVANGKGRGTAANPDGPQPAQTTMHQASGSNSTLRQISGTLMAAPLARVAGAELAALTARVARANGWDRPRTPFDYPPFTHVVYVIKENRTYDQVLGDLPEGDGDTTLLFFGPRSAPNHKALARRFGLFDRFFVNAEVSPDGHNWSTAAYTTDYLQKTVPSEYSERGRSYDYEGTNRGSWEHPNVPADDVNEPASGYLWDLAVRRGITLRNYGEFVIPVRGDSGRVTGYRGVKRALAGTTNPRFPGFDLSIPDQRRADIWIAELQEYAARGEMPALEIVRLPNDHTTGARAGTPTPRAIFADNDLALGRMVEALSRSPFWRNTVMFVLEDDAQNGPDHVDSHRSPLLVISAWNRPGTVHRFANTTDVIRTMEEILGLQSLSHFDGFGRPLREIWAAEPDLAPYAAVTPVQPLDERNPPNTPAARASARLDLRQEDVADEDLFNRVLWEAIKGPGAPYPGARRMPALEAVGR